MKADAVEGKYGSELTTIDCKDINLQLQEDDLVIGTRTRKALKKLTHGRQERFILGVRSFYGTAASKLQDKLPLKNSFLQQLGCLNPLKKSMESTVDSNQPEKIPITEELMKEVRSSHAMYKQHQEREKEEERKRKEDEERREGILEEKEKEREKMVQKKESLKRSADSIKEEEMNAIEKLNTADELVKDASKKLESVLAMLTISKSSIDAANMMLQKQNETRDKAKEE